ncbi:MAG: ATP-binding protein [Pseudomonadota bacterium]
MVRRFLVTVLACFYCLSAGNHGANASEDFEALIQGQEFLNSPFDRQLELVDEYLSTASRETSPLSWAQAASHRANILARQGDFEQANAYLDSVSQDMFAFLDGTRFMAEALYGAGIIKIYSQEVDEALLITERLRRLPEFESDALRRQYRDTLMVAIHSNTGNGILAAEILIRKLDNGQINDLPPLYQLKLVSNISFALITGRDFERAERYLEIGRARLAEHLESGAINPLEARIVRWHINNNYAEMLIQQERYTELTQIYDQSITDADALGAPLYVAAADYISAALSYGNGNLDIATLQISKAVEQAEMLGSPDNLKSFYTLQAKILRDAGDAAGALDAYLKRQSIEDALNAQQTRARTEYMNTRDRISAQAMEISRLEAENRSATELRQRDHIVLITSFIALLTVAGFAIGLFRSRRDLHLYAEELQKSEQKAQTAAQAKSAFLANMSHEIRTPLNGLLGMAQVLAQKEMDKDQRQAVDVMISSGKSLLTIVNDVLDLSKIEAGKMKVTLSATEISSVFTDLMTLWKVKADEKGITLSLTTSPSVPTSLMVDAVRVRQCLSNLISNAIKFTPEGCVSIEVDYDKAQKILLIKVSDTGIGISEHDLCRLFTAFEQGDDSSTRQFGGTGLGLAITRQLARSMGGDVTAESSVGEGSTFSLSLRAEKAEILRLQREDSDKATIRTQAHISRVLLVDDNQVNRLVAKSFLTNAVDAVVEAEHGREALDLIEGSEEPFDVMLLDIQMPVMDGPTTMQAIRSSNKPWASLPIIALTADAMEGDKEKYLALGADGYLAKPVVQADLLREMDRVVRQDKQIQMVRSA